MFRISLGPIGFGGGGSSVTRRSERFPSRKSRTFSRASLSSLKMLTRFFRISMPPISCSQTPPLLESTSVGRASDLAVHFCRGCKAERSVDPLRSTCRDSGNRHACLSLAAGSLVAPCELHPIRAPASHIRGSSVDPPQSYGGHRRLPPRPTHAAAW